MAKAWKWLITGAAVIGALVLAFFAGGSKKSGEEKAAVDAARSDDAVKAAEQQANAARLKMSEFAAQSAAKSAAVSAERADLAAGKVDISQIDEMLKQAGILK